MCGYIIMTLQVLEEPLTATTTLQITKIKVEIYTITLHQGASIKINCYDSDDNYLQSCIYTLTLDEYNSWTDDDTFLETLAVEKLPSLL